MFTIMFTIMIIIDDSESLIKIKLFYTSNSLHSDTSNFIETIKTKNSTE